MENDLRSTEGAHRARGALLLALPLAIALTACGAGGSVQSDATEAASTGASGRATAEDMAWFTRGGDMTRISKLDDWRAASTEDRLASAADLLSRKLPNLPAPAEAIAMARTLEAEITAEANTGERGYLGPILDRVSVEQGWTTE
jgi:hypothetical protein